MNTARYLSASEKSRLLQELNDTSQLLDAGVSPLLQELNAIDGVCTVQSCVGHYRGYFRRHVESAHIELRLDAERTRRLYRRMGDVFAAGGVEDVQIRLRPGYEIVRVESRPGTLALAVTALVAALEGPCS